MDAGNDQFVVVLSVHVSAYVLGYRSRPDGRLSKISKSTTHPMAPLNEALKDFTTVIVTGGSSGIGKSFIERCLALNPALTVCNLSRRDPQFDAHSIKLRHFPCDLAQSEVLKKIAAEVEVFLEKAAPEGRVLLLNNSGFGAYGHFPEPSIEHVTEMIDVNVRAVVELTGLLLPLLRRRGGVIVTVASTAAFQPTAYMATYGASKSFVLHWSLALNEELRGTGVRAFAICPGPVRTAFHRLGWGKDLPRLMPTESAGSVAARVVRVLERRRRNPVVASGPLAPITMPLTALLGEAISAWGAGRYHRPGH